VSPWWGSGWWGGYSVCPYTTCISLGYDQTYCTSVCGLY
jgi:hypothetical protein